MIVFAQTLLGIHRIAPYIWFNCRPGLTAKVLGSVSLAVLQLSQRPVLVVWPPTE